MDKDSHQSSVIMSTVAVIGCGVIGLSTALAIQDQMDSTVKVIIFTKELSPNTTGDIAAGLWTPYILQDTPPEQITEWSKATQDYVLKLWQAGEAKPAGISLELILFLSTDPEYKTPDWVQVTLGHSDLSASQLERYGNKFNTKFTGGVAYVSFIWEASKFLPYLQQKFIANGGQIVLKEVGDLADLVDYDVVVNCTGLMSRFLVPDPLVQPIRGQVARVWAPWQFHSISINDGDDGFYVIPNQDCVILGGTHQVDDFNTTVEEGDKEFILRGCYKSVPSLQGAPVIKHSVGLRPGRNKVRLELERRKIGDKVLRIVHNYGHGGSGITLSIGCALNAAKLVKQALDRPLDCKL